MKWDEIVAVAVFLLFSALRCDMLYETIPYSCKCVLFQYKEHGQGDTSRKYTSICSLK